MYLRKLSKLFRRCILPRVLLQPAPPRQTRRARQDGLPRLAVALSSGPARSCFQDAPVLNGRKPRAIQEKYSPCDRAHAASDERQEPLKAAFGADRLGRDAAARLEAELGLALARDLDDLGLLGGLGDVGALLREDELNVRRVGHVGSDAAVGAVGAAALLDRGVGLRVRDVQAVRVEALDLGVGLGVLDEVEDDLGGLLGPLALVAGGTAQLALRVAAAAARELGEGHGLLVLEHGLEEALGLAQRHALDGVAHLAAVLEVHAQVRPAGLGGALRVLRFLAVGRHDFVASRSGSGNWRRP